MKKISTLFKKDANNLALVINEVNPENQWVIDGEGIPTRKLDGTACAIINGELYKRYDVKKGKPVPENAIHCQEADPISGHHPHWIKCDRNNPGDKYHFQAYDIMTYMYNKETIPVEIQDGTYELIGEKVQGNPEKILGHQLIKHGSNNIINLERLEFEYIKEYLSDPLNDIEGIVFNHKTDGRMCKIRKSDFGIKRI